MIRFLNLKDQIYESGTDFAFYDTITDTILYFGEMEDRGQVFEDVVGFISYYRDQYPVDNEYNKSRRLDRYLSLIPDDFFNISKRELEECTHAILLTDIKDEYYNNYFKAGDMVPIKKGYQHDDGNWTKIISVNGHGAYTYINKGQYIPYVNPTVDPSEKYKDPFGIWEVSTEGDCEGRSITNLGIYSGYVDEIAFHLADKSLYKLRFKKLDNTKKYTKIDSYTPKKKEVNISFDIESKTWDFIKTDDGHKEIKHIFRNRPVTVNKCNYYASVTLSPK